MKKVTIYTDGGCRGNGSENNVGAYGIVMMYRKEDGSLLKREYSQGTRNTTNNIMELTAVIEALKKLKYPCIVELYTDSKYVCDAINKFWLTGWINKGWVTSSRQPVKNKELWQELVPLLKSHFVTFNWVKGHSDNEYNNRCDELANIKMNELQGE